MSYATPANLIYPESRRANLVETLSGVEFAELYRWLEYEISEETKVWVEAENEVTFDYLAAIPERDAIRDQLAPSPCQEPRSPRMAHSRCLIRLANRA